MSGINPVMHERFYLDFALNKGIKSALNSCKESSKSQEPIPLLIVRNIRRRKGIFFLPCLAGIK